jgi:hypothetical protein
VKLMQRLATSSLVLLLGACSSNLPPDCCIERVDLSGGGGQDFSVPSNDFAFPQPDFGINDLAFPQPDFGQGGDFGHHHHHDLGFPGEDFAFPTFDFAQPPGVDLSPPPVQDFATRPDLGGSVVACETCLQASCSTDVSACQADASCVTTLSCVIANGCFTFAGGSSSFGNCVDSCVFSQSLTVQQTVAVLGEIGALSSCDGSCVDTCGGN